jgi:hypothetical protein
MKLNKRLLIIIIVLIGLYLTGGYILVKIGSYFFTRREYTEAQNLYKIAKIIFPWSTVPKTRLNNVEKVINQQRQQELINKNCQVPFSWSSFSIRLGVDSIVV